MIRMPNRASEQLGDTFCERSVPKSHIAQCNGPQTKFIVLSTRERIGGEYKYNPNSSDFF
jgi:hypothetical protein